MNQKELKIKKNMLLLLLLNIYIELFEKTTNTCI